MIDQDPLAAMLADAKQCNARAVFGRTPAKIDNERPVTKAEQSVLDYLNRNPRAETKQVMADLGLSRADFNNRVSRLREKGFKIICENHRSKRQAFYWVEAQS